MFRSLFIVIITVLFSACSTTKDNDRALLADHMFHEQDSVLEHADRYSDIIEIKYAKGLKVDYRDDGIHVTISNPDPAARANKAETFIIKKSSSRFICTTALQLGNFEILGLEDRIVGINTLRNIFSIRMIDQLEEGKTMTIGREGNFDTESVIAAHPDYILVSASKFGGFEALRDCGIPLIPHHGYKETHPLAQAEWIKLIGILTGETRRANAIFSDIESKYLTLRDEVEKAYSQKKSLPTVASGRQLRDGWYFVGGNSYMAHLFKDAGADYIMKDYMESGGVTHDFESVYAKSVNADYWQTDGSYSGTYTLASLAAEDERYTTMTAYKKQHVIFCNLSETPYRELGGVQPHYLLADFVKAFHPELLPHYEPKYYKLLRHP